MELIETCNKTNGLFFPQREFMLVDNENITCILMAMDITEESRLDLTVMTVPEYRRQGYATIGLRMLINGHHVIITRG